MRTGPEHKIDSVERQRKARNSVARWRLISILFGCAAVLIGISLLSNMLFTGKLGSPPFTETNPERLHQFEQLGEYLTAALASVDQLVSMLTTVQLSLFVLAGVGSRKALDGTQRLSAAQIAGGSLFLIFAFSSLTLGYAARMQMARLVWVATDNFDSVRETVVHQAVCVILSAAIAVCVLVIPFVERPDGSSSGSTVKATDIPPAANRSGRTE
jgi:hypothetical protein